MNSKGAIKYTNEFYVLVRSVVTISVLSVISLANYEAVIAYSLHMSRLDKQW